MSIFCMGRPDARGRALALVHGAGGDHRLWGAVHGRLREAGVPALAVDLPGHGRSHGPGRATVGAYADAVEEALAAAGVREHAVAGHSLGGAVALTLAVRAPEGLRGVAAVSTGARLPVDPMILKGTLKAFACTVENLARFCFPKGTAEAVWGPAAEALAAAGPQVLHDDFAACAAYGLSAEDLGRIRIPVEVVCGELDVLTPLPLSQELAAAIPSARLTRLAGVAHLPLLEDPSGLAAALRRLWVRAFGEGAR